MFCGQCGKSVDADTKFCPHCGAVVAAAATPQPAFTPPPPITPARPAAAPGSTAGSGGAGAGSSAGAQASAAAAEAAAALRAVDPASLLARVKGIMLAPRTEWPVIAAESKTAMQIYAGYAAPLVIVSVICGFIGMTVFGITVPFAGTVRMHLGEALLNAILGLITTFVGLFVLSLIINALAPSFGGQKDSVRALKVAAYSYTPAWLGGMLAIIPLLGIIGGLIGLYGLYLLYLGLPVLMRVAQDKALMYTIVIILCAIVIGVLASLVVGGVMGVAHMGPLSHAGGSTLGTSGEQQGQDMAAAILSNALGGKSDADKARMKDAVAQMQKLGEQANQAERVARANGTDPAAAAASQVDMNAAMAAVGTMMAGGKDVKPVDFRALKDLLPASVAGLERRDASGQSGEAMGMKGSSATGNYTGDNGAQMTLEIADLGSLSGLAGLASKFDPKMEKETDTTYERTQRIDGQLVHQQYNRQSRSGSFNVMVGNRFAVTVNGSNLPPETLAAAVKAVDTSKLVALAK